MARRKSVARSESAEAPKGCLVLFFAIFGLAGAGFGIFGAGLPALQVLGARDWPAVTCEILESEVHTSSTSDGTSYSARIRFAYDVDGQRYESDRYKFSKFSSNDRGASQAVVDAHPVGATVNCYVDPGDPSSAVIERGFTDEWVLGLISLPFLLIGVIGCFFTVRSMRADKRAEAGTSRPLRERTTRRDGRPRGERHDMDVAKASDSTIAMREDPDGDGGLELESGSRRWTKTIVVLVFTLFWCGMTFGLLVPEALGEGIVLKLFAVPFALVGLLMVGVTIYQFLSHFVPRPRIGLHDRRLEPGGTMEVSWRFRGSVGSISKMKITLEMRELCTYGAGTNIHTDEKTVLTLPVSELEGRSRMERGDGTVEIPAGAMPSFEAHSNAIRWVLAVNGEIPRFPDLKEEYLLWVHPPREVGA